MCSNTKSAWLNPDCGLVYFAGALDILAAIGRRWSALISGTNSPVNKFRSSPKSSMELSLIRRSGVGVGSTYGVLVGIVVNVATRLIFVRLGSGDSEGVNWGIAEAIPTRSVGRFALLFSVFDLPQPTVKNTIDRRKKLKIHSRIVGVFISLWTVYGSGNTSQNSDYNKQGD